MFFKYMLIWFIFVICFNLLYLIHIYKYIIVQLLGYWSKSLNYVRKFDLSLKMICLWFCSLVLFWKYFFFWKSFIFLGKLICTMLCFRIHYSVIMKTFVAVDTISLLLLVSPVVYCAGTTCIRIQFIHFPTI